MNRIFRSLAAMAAILLSASLTAAAQSGPATLIVKLERQAPENPAITIDGKPVTSPATMYDGMVFPLLEPGSHTVTVSLPGYLPETVSVELNAGGRTTLLLHLKKGLEIRGVHAVRLDGLMVENPFPEKEASPLEPGIPVEQIKEPASARHGADSGATLE